MNDYIDHLETEGEDGTLKEIHPFYDPCPITEAGRDQG